MSDPKSQLAEKLYDILMVQSGTSDTISENVKNQQLQGITQSLQQHLQQLAQAGVPREKLEKAGNEVLAAVRNKEDDLDAALSDVREQMRERFVYWYTQFYDESELQALVDFYMSDVGQKNLDNEQRILAQLSDEHNKLLPEALKAFSEDVNKQAQDMLQPLVEEAQAFAAKQEQDQKKLAEEAEEALEDADVQAVADKLAGWSQAQLIALNKLLSQKAQK